MQVKFLKSTPAGGKTYAAGSVAEISDKDARFLISLGKAAAHDAPKPKKAPRKAPVNRSIEDSELDTK